MAAEQLADLVVVDAKLKKIKAELKSEVTSRGSTLMEIPGVGPAGAARILADVGDIARFADRNRFASWTRTAPIDVSSGDRQHHRLSRGGNRQINMVLHMMAVVQPATPPKDAPTTTGKSPPGRAPTRPCAASSDACPTSSTGPCSTTTSRPRRQAREGTGERH
jgi:hypothetical protein